MKFNAFCDKVHRFCDAESLLPASGEVVVAVSGGADSMALLLVLEALFPAERLIVAHFNHGWRPQSAAADAAFVRDYCRERDLTYVEGLARTPKVGSEVDAREQRYAFLFEVAGPSRRIALAHHMDDQAETVLLNLLRGAAATGLAGMRPLSGRLIRPLLCVRRSEVLAFLKEKQQIWREDETNLLPLTRRNTLRLSIFPRLEELVSDGQLVERICRTADLLAADDAELFAQMKSFYDAFVGRDAVLEGEIEVREREGQIDVRVLAPDGRDLAAPPVDHPDFRTVGLHFPPAELLKLPLPILNRLILFSVKELAGTVRNVTATHVQAAVDFLQDEAGASSRDFLYGIRLVRRADDFAFVRNPVGGKGICKLYSPCQAWANQPMLYSVEPFEQRFCNSMIENTDAMVYTCLLWINGIKHSFRVTRTDHFRDGPVMRKRQPGDRYRWNLKRPKRKLKQYLNEQQIPVFWRDHLLLIASGTEILWFPGCDRRSD